MVDNAPEVPSNLSETGSYGLVMCEWIAVTNTNYYEVFVSEKDPREISDWSPTSSTTTNSLMVSGVASNSIRYFVVRSCKILPDGSVVSSKKSSSAFATSNVIIDGSYIGQKAPSNPNMDGAVWFEQDANGTTVKTHRWDEAQSKWVDVSQVVTDVVFDTNSFSIKNGKDSVSPFTVIDGKVFLSDTVVQKMSVSNLSGGTIKAAEVVLDGSANVLRSSNFVLGELGFKIDGSGNLEAYNGVFSGKLQSTTLLIDGDFGIAKSDATDARSAVYPSIKASSTTSFPTVRLYRRHNTDPLSNENNRFLHDKQRFYIYGFIRYITDSTMNRSHPGPSMRLRYRIGSGSWVTMVAFVDGNWNPDDSEYHSVSAGISRNITKNIPSSSYIDFTYSADDIVIYRESFMQIEIKNWV